MFYSQSNNGFYTREIHGDNIPADAVEITELYHSELLDGQSNGKQIVADEQGYPVLELPAPPTPEELLAQVKAARAAAYPPMAEYLDAIVKGDQKQLDTYIAKCQAVKLKYPKP